MSDSAFAESAASIREFLAQRVMDTGYAIRFAEAVCQCGCWVFSLEVDENVGEAWWFCQTCNAVYLLHDVASKEAYEGSPDYEAVDCVCMCDQSKFQIVVGVTLYGQGDTARTTYIGCRCAACGRIECYASWPRVDMPYSRFFDTMRQPRR
jgi:hypothetical protein